MPKHLPVPVVVVCTLYAVYGAVVITLFATGRPVLPAQVNTIVAAGAVICAIVATRRPAPPCDCAADLDALREQVRELQGRAATLVPQRVYVATDPMPVNGAKVVGMDPDSIHAMRRINVRLTPPDDDA